MQTTNQTPIAPSENTILPGWPSERKLELPERAIYHARNNNLSPALLQTWSQAFSKGDPWFLERSAQLGILDIDEPVEGPQTFLSTCNIGILCLYGAEVVALELANPLQLLFAPEKNFAVGCRMLRLALRMHKGDWSRAIAAITLYDPDLVLSEMKNTANRLNVKLPMLP